LYFLDIGLGTLESDWNLELRAEPVKAHLHHPASTGNPSTWELSSPTRSKRHVTNLTHHDTHFSNLPHSATYTMASLNLSTNGQSIKSSYQGVIDAPPPSGGSSTFGQWALFAVQAPLANAFQDSGSKESVLKVQSTGEGELEELLEDFSEGRIQFAFLKIKDPNTGLPKYALIAWVS
jgi:hypothetical protein